MVEDEAVKVPPADLPLEGEMPGRAEGGKRLAPTPPKTITSKP
ncbi:hypothetical protein Agau_C102391 [Agrobacterium tumefaciens F2]|nr:hypothetical protein Agau_C102391 [Agrobacterium tumefaciens F2]